MAVSGLVDTTKKVKGSPGLVYLVEQVGVVRFCGKGKRVSQELK